MPELLKDNDVIPSVSDIPSLFTTIRHPRRRAISIGPQSEADAYETLAYREKRRRESISEQSQHLTGEQFSLLFSFFCLHTETGTVEGSVSTNRAPSKLEQYENMMGTGSSRQSPETLSPPNTDTADPDRVPGPRQATNGIQSDEQEMFSMIKKPRVRYDVEVVTKLIVYIGTTGTCSCSCCGRANDLPLPGIAVIVIDFSPYVFDSLGLAP